MAKRVMIGDELMFPSDYLAAEDFKGRDVTLTIAGVGRAEVFVKKANQNKVKPILTFKETKKKLICNTTNGSSIASMYGWQAKEWVGKRITLYPTTCTVGRSKNEPCVRIREQVPAAKGAKTEPSPLPPDEPAPVSEAEADAIRAEKGCHPDLPGCCAEISMVAGKPQCANHSPRTALT